MEAILDQDTQEAHEEPETLITQPPDTSWGRLVSRHPDQKNVELASDPFHIGRKVSCDLSFADPRISGVHCKLYRASNNAGDLISYLEDTSTNGTFVEGKIVGKGKSVLLKNGCLISLVTKEAFGNFSYVFNDYSKMEAADAELTLKYCIGKTLGTGNFSVVRQCMDKNTKIQYAVKIIDKKKFWHCNKTREQITSEVSILQKIKHHNIISIVDVLDTQRNLYIILEFANDGELFDKICEKGFYLEPEAKEIFKQILSAIGYLHDLNITHRDLKPENILLDSKDGVSTIKVTDFGLARLIGEAEIATTLCGTPMYVAPEVLLHGLMMQGDPSVSSSHQGYGKEVDVWSLGCILYVLLSGRPPFDDSKNMGLWEQIRHGRYSLDGDRWAKISDTAKDLISRLLHVDPAKRYTVKQALQHPWFVKAQVLPTPEKLLPRSMSEIPSSIRTTGRRPSKIQQPTTPGSKKPRVKREVPKLREPYPPMNETDSDILSPVELDALDDGERVTEPIDTTNASPEPQVSTPSPPKSKPRPLSLSKDESTRQTRKLRSHTQNKPDDTDIPVENHTNYTGVTAKTDKNKKTSEESTENNGKPTLRAGREGGALRASSFRRSTRSTPSKPATKPKKPPTVTDSPQLMSLDESSPVDSPVLVANTPTSSMDMSDISDSNTKSTNKRSPAGRKGKKTSEPIIVSDSDSGAESKTGKRTNSKKPKVSIGKDDEDFKDIKPLRNLRRRNG